jgi:hypothetical protein
LHDLIYWAKGVSCVDEVLGETVIMVVCLESCSMFLIPCGEFPAGVYDVGFSAIRASGFIGARLSVYVRVVGFVCK